MSKADDKRKNICYNKSKKNAFVLRKREAEKEKGKRI